VANLVVFRRAVDRDTLDPSGDHPVTPSDSKDSPKALNARLFRRIRGGKSNPWAAFKRISLARCLRGIVKTGAYTDLDGYLLVLLAEQELTAGREQQAQSLLDAAYTAFDRHAQSDNAVHG
jgi:hypothetical protein